MPIIILAIVTALFAAIGSWRSISRGRRPGIGTALSAAVCAVLLFYAVALLVTDGPAVFTPAYWTSGKISVLEVLPSFLVLFIAMSLVPASPVVFLFQRRWTRNANKMA